MKQTSCHQVSARLVAASLWTLVLPCLVAVAAASNDAPYLRARAPGEWAFPSDRLLQEANETCTKTCCDQFVEECDSANPFSSVPFAVQVIMIILLILFSALFSGLTLGLMSLDKTGLEIVMEGDDPVYAEYARRIYPLRKNGNLLLCTLLLGNVAVNSMLSILLADKAGGAVGFLASTFIIVIFGEIIPQAACSRYALEIGSRAVPLVRVIVILFYPIAAPMAWLLDKALGAELATTYSNAEMLKLLQIHVQEDKMDKDTAIAMTGALKYRDMEVSEVMTPLANTFMLSVEEKLNFETIARIFKTGYSRIPVYEINKNHCVGLLFVKDLIFIDPEDETRVADFIEIFGRGVHIVWPHDKLGDVLRELKQGRSHMALVRDVHNEDDKDPYYEVKGIITLEDIIEEILGDEIVDETDAFVDGTHKEKVDRAETFKWARLRLLDSKIVDQTLSLDETKAVTAHLSKNYPAAVALLTEHQLNRLIAETHVHLLPTANQEVGEALPRDLLYEKGTETDICTLLLAGKVTVLAGSDNFRSDVSSWCLLAAGALNDIAYKPDFSAFVSSGPLRCLRITRGRFEAAVDASASEKEAGGSSDAIPAQDAVDSLVGSLDVSAEGPDLNASGEGQEPDPPQSTELDTSDAGTRKGRLISALQMVGGSKSALDRPAGDDLAGSASSRRSASNRMGSAPTTPKSSFRSTIQYIGSPSPDSPVTKETKK